MSTSYGLDFEPFPLLIGYELGDWLHLRTDDTKDALTLGSHMNGEVSEMGERLEEYEEAGHSGGYVLAEEERLWRELCSRLIGGESDCCEAMSSFHHSLIVDYSTDEDKRAWLQSKGLHMPVVPVTDDLLDGTGLTGFDLELSDDYLEQLYDLFWMYPGYTEDGKPCVWVNPGRWRSMRVVLAAESLYNPALFLMLAWDWESKSFKEVSPEVSAVARDSWIIDGYLDRAEISYNFTRTEIDYRLPKETHEKLERELNRSKVYGESVKLERSVRVLDDISDFDLDGVLCKVAVRVG